MVRKIFIRFALVLLAICFVNLACTKLDTTVYDKVVNFWQTPQQIAAGVAPAYSALRNAAPGFWGGPFSYTLTEFSSDEMICPKRITDWNDDVIWEQMWKHTWTPNHQFFADGWQFIYGGVASINSILETVEGLKLDPKVLGSIEAELKTVRAYYYFLGLDMFGNIPIVTDNSTTPAQITNVPRAEVFAFVEKELKDNLPNLSASVSKETYGRATQWFAYSLLAKLYLNAAVYTGQPRWADCIASCQAILDAGAYSLEPDFFTNFKVNNENSTENIFVLPFDIDGNLNILSIQITTLHYFSGLTFGLASGGANGWCSPAAIYDLFDPLDKRRNSFIVGQQYVNQIHDAAHKQFDRAGNPLDFDPVITTFDLQGPKTESAGARCGKWEFNKNGFGNMSNDFAIFRLADIIMMKAEAELRNGDAATALTTINQQTNGVSIRSRAGLPDFQPADMNLDSLLNERAREFSWEGWRRNDLIRFNHFTDARVPEKNVSEPFRLLYPIPYNELAKNPYLRQNPGY